MSIQRDNLFKRVTNVIAAGVTSVWYAIIGGVGAALDAVDPAQIELLKEFSVTTATGAALDSHGADWGVPRRYNEPDEQYRQRILGQLSRYAGGPTIANIKAVVRAFTGIDPDIFEYGPDGFTMGYSVMGTFGFSVANQTFTFLVTVKNPNNVSYNQQDLIDAVNEAKPARSTAEFQFL